MGTWKQVQDLLNKSNSRSALIICHRNADPDALGSSQSLKNLILESCPSIVKAEIAAESVNQVSKRIVEAYPEIKIADEVDFEPDVFFLVDVNSLDHVGKFMYSAKRSERPIIIVDHHVPQSVRTKNVAVELVDEGASSTAEIVCLANVSIARKPSRAEATVLLAGIIYDSKRFSRIGERTFYAADFLIGAGADYKCALTLLRSVTQRPERIARLKAGQRAKVFEIGEWVVAHSTVSSFGASACRALIELGADVAVVSSKKRREKRISARSSSAFYELTGMNLAKLMEKVGKEFGGSGGGHPTAASVSGISQTEEAERSILRSIEDQIHEGHRQSIS